ncbi:hypothetical protein E2542_SST00166 [Spatholobus suberectus]|nr:hypothetical protein E2542_SST00166 [Spatholobus suberectus]
MQHLEWRKTHLSPNWCRWRRRWVRKVTGAGYHHRRGSTRGRHGRRGQRGRQWRRGLVGERRSFDGEAGGMNNVVVGDAVNEKGKG